MSDKKPLVTMITYCYNGGRFVSKYFDAILSQTYSNIELFFYNNGSEDNTGEIAESYRERLEKKGITYNLIHLEKNNPQTCKLKVEAIRKMKGEYYFGCDSDDIIHPDYVETMVNYLEEHPEKGIVFCQLNRVREDDGSLLSVYKSIPRTNKGEAITDIAMSRNTMFPAISYMMSAKWLHKINPEKKFYISPFGENYQMQIPFLYHDLQGYIERPLGDYTIRVDSFSAQVDLNKKMYLLSEEANTVSECLKLISDEAYEKYGHLSKNRATRDRFYVSLQIGDKGLISECYKKLKEEKLCTIKDRASYALNLLGLYKIIRHK